MRILTIVGARPQFIKAAPLSRAIRRQHQEFLVHTGQHYDPEMSDIFFEELAIPRPDLNLGIGALSNLEQVSHMMTALQPIIKEQRPDWLMVYGDTNSTLAGALSGRMLGVPVAHIEAGLRSYNRAMPEEMNRVLTDHISSALFCPTEAAIANLARENITQGVHMVGDVMIDALLQNRERAGDSMLKQLGVTPGRYMLATIHRAGNTDNPRLLSGILNALATLSSGPDGLPIVLPAHPRLRKAIDQQGWIVGPNVKLIPPVGYLDMLKLTGSARLVLTDSGGLQKEAYVLRVPCVTLRDETEWIETVEAGWNSLAGADTSQIIAHAQWMLAGTPDAHPDFYGDGSACERIVEILAAQTPTDSGVRS